jgi:hypothetical protein
VKVDVNLMLLVHYLLCYVMVLPNKCFFRPSCEKVRMYLVYAVLYYMSQCPDGACHLLG